MRNRSLVFVIRDMKILTEKQFFEGRYFYTIPGGGIEQGESPEEAALRELKEECGLDGTIKRKLTEIYLSDGSVEYVFEADVPTEQQPIVGHDPESPPDEQIIRDVCWTALRDMSEKDRAFMWAYGLMEIDGYYKEVLSWGDKISYPE